MWQQLCLFAILSIPIQVISVSNSQIKVLVEALDRTFTYISDNYDKINVDCLYGVVIAGSICEDSLVHSQIYRPHLQKCIKMSTNIYQASIPRMERNKKWDFLKYILDPKVNRKSIVYNNGNLTMQLNHGAKTYHFDGDKENFFDDCLWSLVNQTKNLIPAQCVLPLKCVEFIRELDEDSEYLRTHKLLLLQIARQRNCITKPHIVERAITKLCSLIYSEIFTLEMDRSFDLFLEQSLLCGLEGFSEFFHDDWLNIIISTQHKSGCFPLFMPKKHIKRDYNIWKDNCSDHPTGLGTAVLSLYLNYFIKNK